MTTANKISIGRVLVVPCFIVLMLYYQSTGDEVYRFWSILCFAIAAISDGVDGYIARHYNQRSELGKVLDPLADKLLLVSGLVLLCLPNPYLHQIPLWLAAIVFGRDVILGLGIIVIYMFCGRLRGRPHIIGKTSTVFQMAVVLWTLFKWNDDWLYWIMLAAGLTTGISAVIYIVEGIRHLGESPGSSASESESPKPKQS